MSWMLHLSSRKPWWVDPDRNQPNYRVLGTLPFINYHHNISRVHTFPLPPKSRLAPPSAICFCMCFVIFVLCGVRPSLKLFCSWGWTCSSWKLGLPPKTSWSFEAPSPRKQQVKLIGRMIFRKFIREKLLFYLGPTSKSCHCGAGAKEIKVWGGDGNIAVGFETNEDALSKRSIWWHHERVKMSFASSGIWTKAKVTVGEQPRMELGKDLPRWRQDGYD